MKFGIKQLNIGFTGTQQGMSDQQKVTVHEFLLELEALSFHHGDCIGADKEAHSIACECNCNIVIHPPIIDRKRAFCKAAGTGSFDSLKPKTYMGRNQDIVVAADLLIATPKGNKEELRSGTWATVRKGLKLGKFVYIIWPDGSFQQYTGEEK